MGMATVMRTTPFQSVPVVMACPNASGNFLCLSGIELYAHCEKIIIFVMDYQLLFLPFLPL